MRLDDANMEQLQELVNSTYSASHTRVLSLSLNA